MTFEEWYAQIPMPIRPQPDDMRQAWNAAAEAEREACAKIADADFVLDMVGGSTGNAKGTARRIAAEILLRDAFPMPQACRYCGEVFTDSRNDFCAHLGILHQTTIVEYGYGYTG